MELDLDPDLTPTMILGENIDGTWAGDRVDLN